MLIISLCVVGFASAAQGDGNGSGFGKKFKSQLVETKVKSLPEPSGTGSYGNPYVFETCVIYQFWGPYYGWTDMAFVDPSRRGGNSFLFDCPMESWSKVQTAYSESECPSGMGDTFWWGGYYVGSFDSPSNLSTGKYYICPTFGDTTFYYIVNEQNPPVASFTATPTSGPCPLTVTFSDTSTGSPASWLWDFGDGNISTEQNPVHVYTSPGTFYVDLTVSNCGGSDTTTKSDFITGTGSTPVADFTGAPNLGYAPLTIQFTDTSENDPTSWSWDFGDGGNSALQNPSYEYTSPGTYTVSLTVSNSAGSDTRVSTDYITVIDSAYPPDSNFTGAPKLGYAPLTVYFNDTSSGSLSSWSWSFGDGGTSVLQNPSHEYTSPGTYTVSLTVSNGTRNDTETKTDYIEVKNLTSVPIAEFAGTPTFGSAPLTVQFTDTSIGSPTSWSWSFGDGGTSELENPSHEYTYHGTYTVNITVINGAGSDTETKEGYIVVLSPGDDNDLSYPEFGAEYKNDYLVGSDLPKGVLSAQNFSNAFLNAGWTQSFFIGDENRNPTRWTYDGRDYENVDGTDLVYFSGHGANDKILLNTYPGNWIYFRNCEWGDYDLEWLLLDSCHTVNLPIEFKYSVTHWALNGIHLVCGFDTVGYDIAEDGPNVANRLLAGNKIRHAWYLAMDETHGSEVAVGIIGENAECGNDYVWKEGSVIADPVVDSEIYRWLYYCN